MLLTKYEWVELKVILEPEHVNQIFEWFNNYDDVENYVKVASKEDLKENDYNLNIPLYVEKIIRRQPSLS